MSLIKKGSLKNRYMEKYLISVREELYQRIHNLRSNGTRAMLIHELYELMPTTKMRLMCIPKLTIKFKKGFVYTLALTTRTFMIKENEPKNYQIALNEIKI